ncbi:MAG: alpha/beta hydrolase [Breznakibacter sp.]
MAETGDTGNIRIIRDIVYASYQGHDLHLDLVLPRKQVFGKRHPVIVMVHGGGWRSGDKSMEMPMSCELARRGYATAMVEYRMSMEALYPAAVMDIKTAIRWIRANAKKYALNTRHIAVQGNSAGGQMASLIGSINGEFPKYQSGLYPRQSDKVQAVLNIDGVLAFIHPESGEGKDLPGKPSAATLWFGSPVEENPDVRHEASALTHVNKHSAPTLFINSSIPRFHGGRDDMVAKMDTFGIYSEVHEHTDCMHTFWLFHPYFNQTIDWMDAFLRTVWKL